MGQNVECQNVDWDKMSKNSIICRSCPCPRPRPCVPVPVPVHLPMSTSMCPCPCPCPLGTRTRTGTHVCGPGQISPVKFSQIYYTCVHTEMSNRFFFSNNNIILNTHISPYIFDIFNHFFDIMIHIVSNVSVCSYSSTHVVTQQ